MPTLKKRGESWQLDYYDARGKRCRQSLGAIPEYEAKTILHAKEYELRTGTRILPTGLILANFADEYLSFYAVEFPASFPRINQIINQHLVPAFGYTAIDNISKRDVDHYRHARIKQGVKRATINKEVTTLKAVINKALDWDYIKINPLQRVRGLQEFDSKPPRFYTVPELERLYQFSPYHWHWWRFMVNTGVRRSEALHIQPKRDIGADAVRIISTDEARTKSARWREVPLSDSARMAIERFNAKGAKFLFPQVNPRSMTRAFEKCATRAELDPIGSVHCLRHSFCSHLVMNGAPLRAVQALAGHANMKTTERYSHLAPGFVADSVAMSL
jgi:site-specific recombinase XerD